MDASFWSDIGTALLSALVSAAAVGGGLWWALSKGIEARLAKLLAVYQKDLNAQLHKQNTVFTRIDQKRAEGILAIDACLRSFQWELVDFSPKVTFQKDANALVDAAAWAFRVSELAKSVLKACVANALLLPNDVVVDVFQWYRMADNMCQAMLGEFLQLDQKAEFKAATDAMRRQELVTAKNVLLDSQWSMFGKVTAETQGRLRAAFEAIGLDR